MATKLRPKLRKFEGMAERPLILDPSLICLFRDLGERHHGAMVMAMIIQKIAHMQAKTKSLNLEMQEFFDLFPFVDHRYLRTRIYKLRKYGIWKNKKYCPHSNMSSYTNVRISWPAIAKLAKKVQKEKQKTEVQNATS